MIQPTRFASWLIRTLAALLLAAVLCPLVASAQTPAPTLDEYLTLLRAASAASQRQDRLGLDDLARQLAAIRAIQITPTTSAPVDNRWLNAALRPADPDFAAIEARLGAIINALAQPASAAPADALARLNTILDNPPFGEQPTDTSWWRDFFSWIGRVLDTLLRPVGTVASGSGGTAAAWIVGSIGVLLLVGVIVYLLLGLRRSLIGGTQTRDADPEAHLTARSALDQASDIARSGDHRTAMRYLYLSALLWLDERDMLRYDRALTNREYLDRVREHPALRDRLTPIVDTFDRVWYGHAPLDDAAFAAYRAQVEALRSEVR